MVMREMTISAMTRRPCGGRHGDLVVLDIGLDVRQHRLVEEERRRRRSCPGDDGQNLARKAANHGEHRRDQGEADENSVKQRNRHVFAPLHEPPRSRRI
jgi:hypothetical protein